MASLLVPAVAAGLAGCESTQDKSKRLSKQGNKVFQQHGLVVTKRNTSVQVVGTAFVQDQNGSAVVVRLRNSSASGMANVPVALDVIGPNGRSLFKNDQPGLAPSLVQAPMLPARGVFDWVNDQVPVTTPAKSVKAVVGEAHGQPPAKLPQVGVSSPTVAVDPVSGVEASGTVTNSSTVEQRALVVYCVSQKGSHVLAAGRSLIPRLKPGKKAQYHIFFIGNPRGGKLSVSAPPTVLQ